MKEMSPEASQLVSAGRLAFHPTEADRARLMAALTATATLSAGAAMAAAAERSFLSSVFGVSQAARVLAIALPVAAAGGYAIHASQQSTELTAPAPVRQPPAAVSPKVAKPPLPVEPQVVEPPSEPSAPVVPERTGAAVAESTKPGNEIRQEVALLSKAQAALSRGRPQEALEAIAEHAQRFPRGVLAEERAATRARTLCALGRRQEAAAELKRIEGLNPTSPYLARARESCGF
jgi:hypothetical protein